MSFKSAVAQRGVLLDDEGATAIRWGCVAVVTAPERAASVEEVTDARLRFSTVWSRDLADGVDPQASGSSHSTTKEALRRLISMMWSYPRHGLQNASAWSLTRLGTVAEMIDRAYPNSPGRSAGSARRASARAERNLRSACTSGRLESCPDTTA